MRVTVVRTGGFAGLRLTWSVQVDDQPDPDAWIALVDAVPWDAAPEPAGEADRFVYRISCAPHEVVLGERSLDGPWRVLVDRVRAAASEETPAEPPTSPDERHT